MIHFSFKDLSTLTDSYASPDIVFGEYFDESWLAVPGVQRLLQDIEKVEYIGGGIVRSLINSRITFGVEGIGQGVKVLIVSRFVDEFAFKVDHIGENLYPYLRDFATSSELNLRLFGILNPYSLARANGLTFPPCYLNQFDALIDTEDQFNAYLSSWAQANPIGYASYRQLTNWNKKLSAPIQISMTGKIDSRMNVYETDFSLTYKINFFQSKSSDGKTFFCDKFHKYVVLARNLSQDMKFITHKMFDIERVYHFISKVPDDCIGIVLIDMDKFPYSVKALDKILDTPDNIVFIIVGHHMSTYVRVPFECIYDVNLDRRIKRFNVVQSCLIRNMDHSSYTSVITEDIGSGNALFRQLASNQLLARGAGGYAKVEAELKGVLSVKNHGNILVVIDYATASIILPSLVSLQKDHPEIDIITPTSAEFCLAYLTQKLNMFLSIRKGFESLTSDELLELLRKFDKGTITSETLDLLAFSETFNVYSEEEIKSAAVFNFVELDMHKLQELVRHEKKAIGGVSDSGEFPYAEKDHCFGN